MTEAELQRHVITLAEKHGCRVFHAYDSRKCIGAGFPDLVIVGQEHVLFAELKNHTANRKPAQTEWFYRLTGAGAHCVLWRPADYVSGHIEAVVRDL